MYGLASAIGRPKYNRSQAARYMQTFSWVVDVTISPKYFKGVRDRTVSAFIPVELCLYIHEDNRQDAQFSGWWTHQN